MHTSGRDIEIKTDAKKHTSRGSCVSLKDALNTFFDAHFEVIERGADYVQNDSIPKHFADVLRNKADSLGQNPAGDQRIIRFLDGAERTLMRLAIVVLNRAFGAASTRAPELRKLRELKTDLLPAIEAYAQTVRPEIEKLLDEGRRQDVPAR